MIPQVTADTAYAEKPKLFRGQLTEHFKSHGLPPLTLSYLNKISSLGDGPPISMIWNRRPLYDPDQALEWLRKKCDQQLQAARQRADFNRRYHASQSAA